jgi:putative hydrolase of the HAD superfamily
VYGIIRRWWWRVEEDAGPARNQSVSRADAASTAQGAHTGFGLGRYFDRVLIEGELGVGKPHPRVYTIALATLACRPEEAWSIGDNLEWDVVGPQRLGIYGIWIDGRGKGWPAESAARPDRMVRSITDLRAGDDTCSRRGG